MVIQESKYLGGDMEHTHLVKGLDYALLEKVIHYSLLSYVYVIRVFIADSCVHVPSTDVERTFSIIV